MPEFDEVKILTLKEVAEYFKIHPSTLYRLVKSGKLPGFKIGSDWRFHVEALRAWVAEQHGPKANGFGFTD